MEGKSLLESALDYASQGIPVFPVYGLNNKNQCDCIKGISCPRAGKHPATPHGFQDATTDVSKIHEWWDNGQRCNIGVPTGKVSGWTVVDIDGQEGWDSLGNAMGSSTKLPMTLKAKSGRKDGCHLYFQYNPALKTKVGLLNNVDVRNDGGYIIVSPSRHVTGNMYQWDESTVPLADVPDWLLKVGTQSKKVKASDNQLANENIVEGNRNSYLFSHAMKLVGKGLTQSSILLQISTLNQSSCQPPLDETEIEPIVISALSYKTEPSYALDDDTIMTSRKFDGIQACMAFFNTYYYKAVLGGKTVVLTHGKGITSSLAKTDFLDAHANKVVLLNEAEKPVKAAKYWFEHTNQTYSQVVFNPDPDYRQRKDTLNLWTGFAVKPENNGMAASFLSCIQDVICSGDFSVYEYLMDWLARIAQEPHSKAGANISVALRGSQGVGKSLFIEQFGKLFGDSFATVNNVEAITGHFNAFLQNKIVILGDEAMWGGDKVNKDILKNLITGQTLNIEQKFKDSYTARNYCRFFFTTNSDWAAPVERGNRRFLVLDVAETHRNDKKYFGGIVSDLETGGYSDFLNYLLERDYSERDFEGDLPKTEASTENLMNGLNSVEQYILEQIEEPDSLFNKRKTGWVSTKELHNDYLDWSDKNRLHHIFSKLRFTHLFAEALPVLSVERKQEKGQRDMAIFLPDIEVLENSFWNKLGLTV